MFVVDFEALNHVESKISESIGFSGYSDIEQDGFPCGRRIVENEIKSLLSYSQLWETGLPQRLTPLIHYSYCHFNHT